MEILLRVGPQANHVKNVIGHFETILECLRLFSVDQFNCFNIGIKFALRSSKTKQEFIFSILPKIPTK